MRRREFITLVGAAVGWSRAARAQQPALPVIGYLAGGPPRSPPQIAFESGLRDLAAELVRMRVDLIVAPGAPARLAKDATNTIPIVFLLGADPVAFGLVD